MDKFNNFKFFESQSLKLSEIYSEVAKLITNNNLSKDTIESNFLKREQMGELRIAKNILLPHFENENLESSMVFLIKLNSNCEQRDVSLNNIDVIIAIALKNSECNSKKNNIITFVKLLAYERFSNYISEIKNSREMYNLIGNMRGLEWK